MASQSGQNYIASNPITCTHNNHCAQTNSMLYTQNPWHARTNPCMHRNGCAQRNSIKNPWHACKPLDMDIETTHSVLWLHTGVETTHSVLWLHTGVETTHSVLWLRTGFIPRACMRDHVTLQTPARARLHLVYRRRLGSPVPRRLGRIPLCAHILRPLTSCILVSNLNLTKLWANLRQKK